MFMGAETFYLETSDGNRLAVHRWLPDGATKAVIQISHGMAEYAMRYERFADAARMRGFAVYAADHRGHGMTAGSLDRLGHLADEKGFFLVTEDQKELTDDIKARHPDLPVILYGHSFGSFVAQRYLTRYGGMIDGCVLTGTRGPDFPVVAAGYLVARMACLRARGRRPSSFLAKMSFGACNKRISDAKSENAWLSRDDAEVEKYDASPWSGFTCTAGFYRDMTEGLLTIHKKSEMAKIPCVLPIFLAVGEVDPISKYGKTVKKLEKRYKDLGLSAVSSRYYPEARHELLNDVNRDEVTRDILGWIENAVMAEKDDE
jgi:alpha-beta hydrolase superfamily lysophospholipase